MGVDYYAKTVIGLSIKGEVTVQKNDSIETLYNRRTGEPEQVAKSEWKYVFREREYPMDGNGADRLAKVIEEAYHAPFWSTGEQMTEGFVGLRLDEGAQSLEEIVKAFETARTIMGTEVQLHTFLEVSC